MPLRAAPATVPGRTGHPYLHQIAPPCHPVRNQSAVQLDQGNIQDQTNQHQSPPSTTNTPEKRSDLQKTVKP
jgi:hypothetical protein